MVALLLTDTLDEDDEDVSNEYVVAV